MEFLTLVYLAYSFLALYYLTLFVLIYLQNRDRFYEVIEPKSKPSLSIVIPCFNEEENIAKTIEGHLKSDYENLKKIIVVDDRSTDKSYEIIKKYAKKYPKVMALRTPKNTGCAAGAKNYGAKHVRTELIGFSDADSFPNEDAISKMIGFFNDPKVGGVTSRVLVKNTKKLLPRLQAIEYKIIAFTRKLFGFVDSIYVTNGPLSLYRKKGFDECEGFKETNWTEDIEITWNLVSKGYKIHISVPAVVYTVAPSKFMDWFRQRIRWNVGGIQTMVAYRKDFFRTGMLGLFILPFFTLSWILAIVGFLLLLYRVFRTILIRYLTTTYSIGAQTAILRFSDISITPSILFFFGVVLFVLGLLYNVLGLLHSKDESKGPGIIGLLTYMFFYLTAYPAILITSIYKFIKGKKSWN